MVLFFTIKELFVIGFGIVIKLKIACYRDVSVWNIKHDTETGSLRNIPALIDYKNKAGMWSLIGLQ